MKKQYSQVSYSVILFKIIDISDYALSIPHNSFVFVRLSKLKIVVFVVADLTYPGMVHLTI